MLNDEKWHILCYFTIYGIGLAHQMRGVGWVLGLVLLVCVLGG